MTRLLGSELAAMLDGYCATHSITRSDFAALVGLSARTVVEIGEKAFPIARVETAVREFITTHPGGPGGVQGVVGGGEYGGAAAVDLARARSGARPAPVVDPSAVAARERAPARRTSPEYRARLRRAAIAETIATGFVETPADLIATVQRQWPNLWARVVDQSRAAGTLPGAMLARVIERGLEAEA